MDHDSVDSILDEAASLVNGGEREKAYGHPALNFARIARMWSAYLDRNITAHDVCMLMILLKTTRALGGYHRDSAVDIAGYARCDQRIAEYEPVKSDIKAGAGTVEAGTVEAEWETTCWIRACPQCGAWHHLTVPIGIQWFDYVCDQCHRGVRTTAQPLENGVTQ